MTKFAFDPPQQTYGWDTMVGGPYKAENTLDHSRVQYEDMPVSVPKLVKTHKGGVREWTAHGHHFLETEGKHEGEAALKFAPVLHKRNYYD